MIWSSAAKRYMHSFELARLEGAPLAHKFLAAKTVDRKPRELPEMKLTHLRRMTDATGVFQHAVFTVPNFAEGYCADDNARALVLAVQLSELGGDQDEVRSIATTCAAFLHHAFDQGTRRFHNFMSFDRRWLDQAGSEDCQGRALWALGTAVGRSPYRSFQMLAGQIFSRGLPELLECRSPRAWAFALIGIHEYLRRLGGDSMVNQIRDTLVWRLTDIYHRTAQQDWRWYEESLSYDNAKIPHALILSGSAMGRDDVLALGLESLRWLVEIQTSEQGHFRPIGSNGFHVRGGARADFDQQPVEANATVSACLAAFRITGDLWWNEQAQRAFDWFLGWNDLGKELYSPQTGGCCDGLHVDRVNWNQGAESTLAFLLSLAEMRLSADILTSFLQPVAVGD